MEIRERNNLFNVAEEGNNRQQISHKKKKFILMESSTVTVFQMQTHKFGKSKVNIAVIKSIPDKEQLF